MENVSTLICFNINVAFSPDWYGYEMVFRVAVGVVAAAAATTDTVSDCADIAIDFFIIFFFLSFHVKILTK